MNTTTLGTLISTGLSTVWLYVSLTLFLLACRNQGTVNQNSMLDSSQLKNQTTAADSVSAGISNQDIQGIEMMPNTTLDSLQGNWTSLADERDHVKISANEYIETYDGDSAISKSQIFFADTCVSDMLSYNDKSKLGCVDIYRLRLIKVAARQHRERKEAAVFS